MIFTQEWIKDVILENTNTPWEPCCHILSHPQKLILSVRASKSMTVVHQQLEDLPFCEGTTNKQSSLGGWTVGMRGLFVVVSKGKGNSDSEVDESNNGN